MWFLVSSILVGTELPYKLNKLTKSYKKWDFIVSVNPITALFGSYVGQLEYGITAKNSIGILYQYMESSNSVSKIFSSKNSLDKHYQTSVHLRWNYFIDGTRFETSWFVSPFIMYQRISAPLYIYDMRVKNDLTRMKLLFSEYIKNVHLEGFGAAFIFGYFWMLENNWNLRAGVGASLARMKMTRNYANQDRQDGAQELSKKLSKILPIAELVLGMTF